MAVLAGDTESRILLRGIAWSTYEAILADIDGGTRLTYDRGYLEMMSPSREHERLKRLLGRMIETITEEWEIPISSAGSTTLRSELRQRGVEPDECYYVASEPQVRGRDQMDLHCDPPPDLAIEVELSGDSIDKLDSLVSCVGADGARAGGRLVIGEICIDGRHAHLGGIWRERRAHDLPRASAERARPAG